MDIAVVGAGVSLTVDQAGTITAARAALGAVAPRVLLVPEAAAAVDTWRERTSYAKPSNGVPAHVTVLYPFVPAANVDEALLADLRALFAGLPSFAFELRECRHFPAVLYLAPDPPEPFVALTEAVVAAYTLHRLKAGAIGQPRHPRKGVGHPAEFRREIDACHVATQSCGEVTRRAAQPAAHGEHSRSWRNLCKPHQCARGRTSRGVKLVGRREIFVRDRVQVLAESLQPRHDSRQKSARLVVTKHFLVRLAHGRKPAWISGSRQVSACSHHGRMLLRCRA